MNRVDYLKEIGKRLDESHARCNVHHAQSVVKKIREITFPYLGNVNKHQLFEVKQEIEYLELKINLYKRHIEKLMPVKKTPELE